MSVEYSMACCFGVIVSGGTVDAIMSKITDDFSAILANDFYDEFIRPINAWTGEEYFVGLINDLGDSPVILTKSLRFSKEDLETFSWRYSDYHLAEIFEWIPQNYLINFCY